MVDVVRSPETGPFLVEDETWPDGVYQIQVDDVLTGGDQAQENWQARALARRTRWLRRAVEDVGTALAEHEQGNNHPSATTQRGGMTRLATAEETNEGTADDIAVTPLGLKSSLDALPSVPAATTAAAGRARLATVAETKTGTAEDIAVTPLGLKSSLDAVAVPAATTAMAGRARLATVAEAKTGTSEDIAVTPLGLKQTLDALPAATTATAGRARLATVAEAKTGTAEDIAVTPAGLAASMPAALGNYGYRFPDGTIIQWGAVSIDGTLEGAVPVVFRVAFNTACYAVTPITNIGGWSDAIHMNKWLQVQDKSNAGATFYLQDSGGSSGSGQIICQYIAIGK